MRPSAIGISALFAAGFLSAQQKPGPTARPVERTQQVLAAQSKTIADLEKRLEDLEQRVRTLEQRDQERASIDSNKTQKPDLYQVKLELARFDNGCKSDQDRAFALALSDGRPAQTYEGAAAMNCTERLRRIVDKIVEALEKQQ